MGSKQDPEIVREVNALRSFRLHLTIYVIVNGIFWLIWLFGGGVGTYAWPAYPTAIWGVILLLHYIRAYQSSKPEEP
jgi:hypothetical protein